MLILDVYNQPVVDGSRLWVEETDEVNDEGNVDIEDEVVVVGG